MIMIDCRAVLFDLDGALANSTAHVERHWTAWARSRGVDPGLVLGLVHGRRAVDTVKAVAPWLDAELEVAALVEAEVSDTAGVATIPGAAALLASIPRDCWAVVTSAGYKLATARLEAAGLPLPHVLVAAENIVFGKPNPEGYLAAAAKLGVSALDCAVVEDSPAGAAAARAAGMRVIVVATTHEHAKLGPADLAVMTLDNLRLRQTTGASLGRTLTVFATV